MKRMRVAIGVLAVAGAALAGVAAYHPGRAGATATASSTAGTYDQYTRMTEKSAAQFWSGNTNAGQWAWRTEKPGVYSVSWNVKDPSARENFQHSPGSNWAMIDGWSGNGTYYRERVSSENLLDGHCAHPQKIPSYHGLQHYALWNTPTSSYCLDANGTVTEVSSGKVIHFRHMQIWSPPAPCSNAYFKNRTCIRQHEIWWDDNQHPFRKTLERDNYIAKGLGEAFMIRQQYPSAWSADMRYSWTWK